MNDTALFAGVRLAVVNGWFDITDDLPDGSPPTLAKAEGVGALQFTTARYVSGVRPEYRAPDLRRLMEGFGTTHGLGSPTNVKEGRAACLVVSGDFISPSELIRTWYVSNGSDLAFVTYVAPTELDARVSAELAEAQTIVESLEL